MDFNLYIDQIILTYGKSIKIRVLFAFILGIGGILIILLNLIGIFKLPPSLELPAKISGALIASVCGFPIKEIVDRKNKVKLIQFILDQHNNSTGDDKKKLRELIWKFIEKNTID